MKNLTAKTMIILACAVILLHAVVPHHHHDCAGEVGFVFETEINCHCSHQHHQHNDCDEHHSDHPFDLCRLADMLSHLVLNSKEDEQMLAMVVKAEVHDLMVAVIPNVVSVPMPAICRHAMAEGSAAPWALPLPPLAGGHSLRAPPVCA